MTKRVATYTRVSSDMQVEGFSLAAQEEAMRRYMELRGWQHVASYSDPGRSARTALRPDFQRMLADAEHGLFDVILVHKIDRFSRSLIDTLTIIARLDKQGVAFASVSQDFDMTTSTGRMIFSIWSVIAQWYSDNLSEETIKGKAERARQGGWNGSLSFGYTTPRRMRERLVQLGDDFRAGQVDQDTYSREANLIEDALERYANAHPSGAIPDPFTAPGVHLAFSKYVSGQYSDADIAWMLNDAGYRTTGSRGPNPWSKDSVTVMLQNRFYIGETSYHGERLPGNHEPIIDAATFDVAQQVRARRASAQMTNEAVALNSFPLASLLRCACCGSPWWGQSIRGERRYRNSAKQRGRQCAARVRSTRAITFEAQVEAVLTQLELPSDWQQQARQRAESKAHDQTPKTSRKALESRLSRVQDMYEAGHLTRDQYLQKRAAVERELAALPTAESKTANLEQVAAMLKHVRRLWDVATLEERKLWIGLMFNAIYVRDDKIVAVEPSAELWELLSFNGVAEGKIEIEVDVTIYMKRSRRVPNPRSVYSVHVVAPATPGDQVRRLTA